MTPDRAKFNKEVEKGLLDRGVNIPIRAMTEQETAEQRIKIQTDQIASLKRHIGRLETQLANELLVDDGSPLTPHGEAIAAGDGTLHGAIDYWQEQAFTMAAGQCCVKDGGLMGDEHGHQYCDMERQRDELKERAERAETKLAALQASPDVAGLVDAYDAARYRFEEWDGDVLVSEEHAELKRRVDAKNVARQRILDALLSLSAQLAEKEAELQRTCTAMVEITEAEGLGRADRLQNYLFNQVKLRAEKAEAECEGLRQDAERYRWLREHCNSMSIEPPLTVAQVKGYGLDAWSGDDLDTAIDSARARKP